MREMVSKSRPKIHLVNPSSIKWHVQSNNPDEMGDEEVEIPSIAAELTYNYSNYKPAKSGMYSWRSVKLCSMSYGIDYDTQATRVRIYFYVLC